MSVQDVIDGIPEGTPEDKKLFLLARIIVLLEELNHKVDDELKKAALHILDGA